MYDISLWRSRALQLWKPDIFSSWLQIALPSSHLFIFSPPFLNPVFPSIFFFPVSSSAVLFISSHYLYSHYITPVIPVEDHVLISSPQLFLFHSSLSTLSFFAFINITICLSGIPLFPLIWWLNSDTHIVLIGWANGTAAVESQLRWWDVAEMCNTVAHYYHHHHHHMSPCAPSGCKSAPRRLRAHAPSSADPIRAHRTSQGTPGDLAQPASSAALVCVRVFFLGRRVLSVSTGRWAMRFDRCSFLLPPWRHALRRGLAWCVCCAYTSVWGSESIPSISLYRLLLSRCINGSTLAFKSSNVL